jgi:hypothetical protein
MTANEGDDPATAEMPLYGDEETEQASGVPLPSLRVLQAAGAIRSHKVAKEHGGYRRMWSEMDVLKASIAAALGEHFAWNIRVVAAVMAKVHSAIWESLIEIAVTTCNHLRRGSQSSAWRAHTDCKRVSGSGARSLQLGAR